MHEEDINAWLEEEMEDGCWFGDAPCSRETEEKQLTISFKSELHCVEIIGITPIDPFPCMLTVMDRKRQTCIRRIRKNACKPHGM